MHCKFFLGGKGADQGGEQAMEKGREKWSLLNYISSNLPLLPCCNLLLFADGRKDPSFIKLPEDCDNFETGKDINKKR